jgi:hypothetical protein
MKLEGKARGVRCIGMARSYDQMEKEIMVMYDHNTLPAFFFSSLSKR